MKRILLVVAAMAATATINAQTTWGVKAGVDVSTYNISVEDLSASVNPGYKTGFYVGAVNNIWFGDSAFGLQTELLYNYHGTRLGVGKDLVGLIANGMGADPSDPDYIPGQKISASINMHTLRLPIMFKFQPTEGLSIMAGPYVSLRVGTGVRLNDNLDNMVDAMQAPFDIKDLAKDVVKDNIKKFDVGAALGVEYEFDCGAFIDFRYNISFLNSLKKKIDISSVDKAMGGEGNVDKIDVKAMTGIQPTVRYSAIQVGLGYRF